MDGAEDDWDSANSFVSDLDKDDAEKFLVVTGRQTADGFVEVAAELAAGTIESSQHLSKLHSMEKCPFGQKKVICSAGIKKLEDKHNSRRPMYTHTHTSNAHQKARGQAHCHC